MRRLNAERMRRYVARTTPDVVRTRVDGMGEDPQGEMQEWLARWGARMTIKHPGGTSEVKTWQDFASGLDVVVVEARVRLR